jgi:hypothetical protein
MREPKPSWVRALRALTGFEQDDIRYNETLSRWEFILTSADGVPRSQFWGVYKNPLTGMPVKPDPMTGLHPFRELDDETMRDALKNLEMTFVANPFDGAGSTKKEVMKRIKGNRAEGQRRYRQGGEDFADLVNDRAKRLRGATSVGVLTDIGG